MNRKKFVINIFAKWYWQVVVGLLGAFAVLCIGGTLCTSSGPGGSIPAWITLGVYAAFLLLGPRTVKAIGIGLLVLAFAAIQKLKHEQTSWENEMIGSIERHKAKSAGSTLHNSRNE